MQVQKSPDLTPPVNVTLFQGEMVANLLSFFRMMNVRHYAILISSLKGDLNHSSSRPYKEELLKFLNDVLVVMKNLFSKPYFPADWSEMILLQNRYLT